MAVTLFELCDVKKYFPVAKTLLSGRQKAWVKAVDGVSFAVCEGETFGLVGESGCGKTTIAKLLLLLERPTAGSVTFRGKDIQKLSRQEYRWYRSCVQTVLQDPYSSLNPRMKVEDIIIEPILISGKLPKKEAKKRVFQLLEQTGLGAEASKLYPHEFSGGQRQRISLARALSVNPSVIVLDEPMSALDVSVQAQMMNLLRNLQREREIAYLLIGHDLAVVKHMSDRIGVMYSGKIVESAASEELCADPFHPYTKALLHAVLPSKPDDRNSEDILGGEVPSPLDPPTGCRFHPRCVRRISMCETVEPPLREIHGRYVACHLP